MWGGRMTSAKRRSSIRSVLDDQLLTFNCHEFSRGIRSGRPTSRRWVSLEQCLCTYDTGKICDPTQLYRLVLTETSDEEDAEEREEMSSKYRDIPPDRIGVFRGAEDSFIQVPPSFLDVLWAAAVAADGVRRSISLTVQPQDETHWAVFEVSLNEKIADAVEVPFDKRGRPKSIPPRPHPVVNELRGARVQLIRIAKFLVVTVLVIWFIGDLSRWIGHLLR
jgi:hypothetical protein